MLDTIMSSITTKNRIKRITRTQCESWIGDHTIDPTTGNSISAPNSISTISLNYLISSECLKKYNLLREGNPVNDIVDQNVDREEGTRHSVTVPKIDDLSSNIPSMSKSQINIHQNILDELRRSKPSYKDKFDSLQTLLLRNNRINDQNDDNEWRIFSSYMTNKNINELLKYWAKITIKEKEYYTQNYNKYYGFKNLNKKLIDELDNNNFENVKVNSNKSLSKFTNYQLYFKTLFVFILYERKEIKHKFFRDDEIFMRFKKLVEDVVKNYTPSKSTEGDLGNLLSFYSKYGKYSSYVIVNNNLYDRLMLYNPNFRKSLIYNDLIRQDSIDHMSVNSNSGYTSLQNSIEQNCVNNINDIKNDMFKRFKDRITKVYYKYNNVDKFIDLNEFKSFVDETSGNKIPLSDITSFIKKYKGKKQYENESDLYLLKLSKQYFKNKVINDMSYLVRLYSNAGQHNQQISIVIDTESYLSSLFQIYFIKLGSGINILKLPRKHIHITFKTNGQVQTGVDAGGLLNQLITEVSKELFTKNIFTKARLSSGLESEKYFLNPDFDVDIFKNLFTAQPQYIYNKEEVKREFYYFLGSYIQFLLLNGYKLPYRLSSYLLSGFISKTFISKNGETKINTKDEEFTYFMMRDFPDFNQYFINIMKDYDGTNKYKTWINDDTHMPLTEYYKEKSESPPIPKNSNSSDKSTSNRSSANSDSYDSELVPIEGLQPYINNLARHIYLNNPLKDSKVNMLEYHILFFDSIHDNTRKVINNYKISIDDMDHILTQPELDNTIIKNFVNNVLINVMIYNDENNTSIVTNPSYAIEERQTLDMFKTEINKQKFVDKLLNDRDFFVKLLSFWSAKEYYDQTQKYIINIKKNHETYPLSHTCFNVIDVRVYSNFDKFLEELELSVLNTHGRFDIAGGGKSNIKQKK